jgi:two-component system, chemotaxis family, chemotaxis protein CheY
LIIPAQLRVLVVDDNAYARAISAQNLRKLGVGSVVEAPSGAEAILVLLEQSFDFMLMDWYMPDVSGAGLIQVLRDPRFGPASQMPVIMMTAYASRDNLVRARELGVNEVLAKPFTAEQLGTAMGRVLVSGRPAETDAVLL